MAEKHLAGWACAATLVSTIAVSLTTQEPARPPAAVSPDASARRAPIVLNDDGGWCWFQDERALVVGGRLIFGSVAAGRSDPSRRSMVEATSVDLATRAITRFRLSATPVEKAGRYDDHDTPAFVARGDGRLVAVWAGHAYDNRILSRVSLPPGDATAWSDERTFVPSPSSSVTYSNLHRLAAEQGRILGPQGSAFTAWGSGRCRPSLSAGALDGHTLGRPRDRLRGWPTLPGRGRLHRLRRPRTRRSHPPLHLHERRSFDRGSARERHGWEAALGDLSRRHEGRRPHVALAARDATLDRRQPAADRAPDQRS